MKYITEEKAVDLVVETNGEDGTFAVPIPPGPGGMIWLSVARGHSIVSAKLVLNSSQQSRVRLVRVSNQAIFPDQTEDESQQQQPNTQTQQRFRTQTAGQH